MKKTFEHLGKIYDVPFPCQCCYGEWMTDRNSRCKVKATDCGYTFCEDCVYSPVNPTAREAFFFSKFPAVEPRQQESTGISKVWCLYSVVHNSYNDYSYMGPFFNSKEKADKALLEREKELKRRNLTYTWKENSNGKYMQIYDDGIISYTSVKEIPVK